MMVDCLLGEMFDLRDSQETVHSELSQREGRRAVAKGSFLGRANSVLPPTMIVVVGP